MLWGAVPLSNEADAPSGNYVIGISVKLSPQATRTISVNPMEFAVICNGVQYKDSAGRPPGALPRLQPVVLQPGAEITGWLTFNLPGEPTGLVWDATEFVIHRNEWQVEIRRAQQ
ncbi:MAG: hypothetical protein KKI08_14495 [Armatimonadetes bacterium]|nr:hypothetical protein [Armatimonadota bacterium]